MNRLGKRVIHKIDYVLTEHQHFRELIEWNGDFLTLMTSENVMYVQGRITTRTKDIVLVV